MRRNCGRADERELRVADNIVCNLWIFVDCRYKNFVRKLGIGSGRFKGEERGRSFNIGIDGGGKRFKLQILAYKVAKHAACEYVRKVRANCSAVDFE